jgi:hypothetical protein
MTFAEIEDLESPDIEGRNVERCFIGIEGLFAQIDTLMNPELQKLLLRDVIELAWRAHRELP